MARPGRLGGNALTETSSYGAPRVAREPPEAGKAAPRPDVKTLLSAGRNGRRTRRRARCPAGRPPSPGQNEAAGLDGGGESAVAPRAPFSPALPRGHAIPQGV